MYIKGCDNAKIHSTKEENDAYRRNYEHIFGKKDIDFNGKQTYDESTGRWVDSSEYKKEHPDKKKGFLIGSKRDMKVTLIKPNGSHKDGTFTHYNREKVLKMEYH